MALSRYRRDAKHFQVVTPFEWNGRDFAEGLPFPAIELGLGEMERRHLWIANKIRVVDEPVAESAQAAPEPAPDGDPASQPELELVEPRRPAGRRRGQG